MATGRRESWSDRPWNSTVLEFPLAGAAVPGDLSPTRQRPDSCAPIRAASTETHGPLQSIPGERPCRIHRRPESAIARHRSKEPQRESRAGRGPIGRGDNAKIFYNYRKEAWNVRLSSLITGSGQVI